MKSKKSLTHCILFLTLHLIIQTAQGALTDICLAYGNYGPADNPDYLESLEIEEDDYNAQSVFSHNQEMILGIKVCTRSGSLKTFAVSYQENGDGALKEFRFPSISTDSTG